ncbi:CheR family methyltransferase [Verrucomicrobium spinosum]|uniref:CheR family methyltransferase n=1 Tax=Verrucomicrobium spinosum TaxID=2736 RepID=UPI0001745E7F|nr:CheR family methyltransferase [Verrucomicrobium spinosum]
MLSESTEKKELQVLANDLSIGESCFFRDARTFQYLAEKVLSAIIRGRRGSEQRLRVWSAGCCTGVEAYSLAILINQLLPDLKKWQVSVLATDVNGKFLKHAVSGVYGEFALASERYAVEAKFVCEVYPLKDLSPLPSAPSFIAGMVNVRGRILPVLELRRFFDVPGRGITDLQVQRQTGPRVGPLLASHAGD